MENRASALNTMATNADRNSGHVDATSIPMEDVQLSYHPSTTPPQNNIGTSPLPSNYTNGANNMSTNSLEAGDASTPDNKGTGYKMKQLERYIVYTIIVMVYVNVIIALGSIGYKFYVAHNYGHYGTLMGSVYIYIDMFMIPICVYLFIKQQRTHSKTKIRIIMAIILILFSITLIHHMTFVPIKYLTFSRFLLQNMWCSSLFK